MKFREVRTSVRDWWIDHAWVDLVLVSSIVAIHLAVVVKTDRFDVLGWLTASDRRGVYAAAAVVVSLTGALSGVAVSQLGSAKGDRAIALKKQAGTQLADSWRSVYSGAMLAAVLALVALALDSTANPPPAGHNAQVAIWVFEFGLFLGISKFFRLTALFHPLIVTAVKDDVEGTENERGPAPTIDITRFERRASNL